MDIESSFGLQEAFLGSARGAEQRCEASTFLGPPYSSPFQWKVTYGCDMTTLPESLKTEFSRWASHGARPQQEFTWRPRSWKDGFGKRALDLPGVNLLEAVESIAKAAGSFTEDRSATIDREMVKNLHDPEVLHPNGSTEPQAVVTAFIASMIWGYGTTGYGPYRTARVLGTDPAAVSHLVAVARTAQDRDAGGDAAFREIWEGRCNDRDHLKYLGPAFGTKFLYFLTAAADDVPTTPVMDAVVRRWFSREAKVWLNVTSWKPSSYEKYLSLLDTWREALAPENGGEPPGPDQVEYVIFAMERGDLDNLPEEFSADQLLDMLQSDIEQLDDARGGTEGMALFTKLSEWVTGIEELSE